jgi:hypothetical protein
MLQKPFRGGDGKFLEPLMSLTRGDVRDHSEAALREWTAAFVQRIAQLGWTEGGNLKIAYRWADGATSDLPRLQPSSLD